MTPAEMGYRVARAPERRAAGAEPGPRVQRQCVDQERQREARCLCRRRGPHRRRLARRVRAARRAARHAAALEPRPEERHRGAALLRQAARHRQHRSGRRHQISLAAEPPRAAGDARAGPCADAQAQVFRCAAGAARQLAAGLPLRRGRELVERARGGGAADQLVGGLAAVAFRRKGRRVPGALAALHLPALRVHPRLVHAARLRRPPPGRRGRGPVHRDAHLAELARVARLGRDREGDPRARNPGADRARRRAPRAVGVRAPVRARADAAQPARRQGERAMVLELMQLSLLAGKANGQWFSPDTESRVEAMLDFLASIMDAGGNVPMFGDSDDGLAARLTPAAEFAGARSLLATGALLFKRGDFKLKARALDDRTRWLLGARADAEFAELDAEQTRLPLRQAFPEGGWFVVGCGFDTPREIRLVADAGPLGFRRNATHGHADALSFTLSVGGREFLVDPGTYAYHTQQAWRRYFRGTAAHNTVRIDGLDQAVSGGRFRWRKKARAGCSLWLSSPEKDSFEAWHDAYLRLDDPVKHRRLIELDKAARRVLIEDTLEMGEEHDVELFFHFSERCKVDPCPGGFVVTHDGISLTILLPEGGSPCVYQGNLSPMLGWRSRAFDVRVPAPTIVWQARLSGTTRLRTLITVP